MQRSWHLLFFGAILIASQTKALAEPWPFHRSCSTAERHVLTQLNRQIRLSYDEEPLREAFENLAHDHNFRIVFDNEAMLTKKVDQASVVVSLDVRDVSLRSALQLMLKPLGLTYVVRNDVLMITTPDRATDLRVYNVNRLVDGGVDRDSIAKVIADLGTSTPIQPAPYRHGRVGAKPAMTENSVVRSGVRFLGAKDDLLAVRATDEQHIELANAIQSLWSAVQVEDDQQGDDEFRSEGAGIELARNRNSGGRDASPCDELDPFGDAAQSDPEDPFGEEDPFGDAELDAGDDPFSDF